MSTNTKEILNICFIGHVDSGKSTTVGQLAASLGAIDKRAMDKLKKEAEDRGRGTFCYAYLMDMSAAERDRGITITTSLMKLETKKHMLNLIDCPGHKDFIKNMVTGAAQADVGVVLVPAAEGEFEACIDGGTLKDHIMISGVFGCNKLIVCINKIDTIASDEDKQKRFNEVATEMARVIKVIHKDKTPIIIPISGYHGVNIIDDGNKYEWFKGVKVPGVDEPVRTLEGALNSMTPPPRPIDKPMRMPIDSIHKISGIGMVYTGRVATGTIKVGMQLGIEPSSVVAECKTLEIHKTSRKEVVCGENCGVALKAPTKGDVKNIRPGHVLSDNKTSPVQNYEAARATIIIVKHPKGIGKGYCPTMDIGTIHVPCQLKKIFNKRILGPNRELIESPDLVSQNEQASVIIHPQKPVVMETLKDCPPLARFAMRDGNRIVAIGSIDKLYTKEEYLAEVGDEVKGKKRGPAPAG